MGDRREFLKLMTSALGCALLAGCGGSGASGGGGGTGGGGTGGGDVLPSGYRVTPVMGNGASLGDGLTVVDNLVNRGGRNTRSNHPFAWYFDNQAKSAATKAHKTGATRVLGAFPGQAWITDTGEVGFLALDNKGSRGFYVGTIQETSEGLSLTDIRKVIRIGEKLPGGASIVGFTPGDVGPNGTAAMRVESGDYGTIHIYVNRGDGLERLLSQHQRIPTLFPQGRATSRLYGTISIHDNDDILMAPGMTSAWEMRSMGQGLLYLPGGRLDEARIVFHTGEMLPDSTSTMNTISAFQLTDEGRYVVMGTALQPATVRAKTRTAESDQLTYVLTGNVREPSILPRLVSASRSIHVSRSRAEDETFVPGTLAFNPRIGADGTAAYVVSVEPYKHALFIDGRRVITGSRSDDSGDLSPTGSRVRHLTAPVVGPQGQVFCVLGTQDGQELSVFTRDGHQGTLLKTRDKLGGKDVVMIVLGQAARQVNRDGRLAFRVDYTDATSSLVIADPV